MKTNFIKGSCFGIGLLALVIGLASCSSQKRGDVNGPNVLIIGDSLANSYINYVIGLQHGKMNVRRPLNERAGGLNCEGTTSGVANVDQWLGDEEWDLIYFNFGLHDLMHVYPDNRKKGSSVPSHPQQATPDVYRANLQKIVTKLKMSEAKLVFANTIPIRESDRRPLRRADQVSVYNGIAEDVMNDNGIYIHDMNGFVRPRMEKMLTPQGVNLTSDGNLLFALEVSSEIERVMGIENSRDLRKNASPKVLLLGDSVSLGYTPFVRGMLYGEADIYRPMNTNGGYLNCAGTHNGLANVDAWLAVENWDVIHFNFGLHDLKHVFPGLPNKNSTDPNHPQQSDPGVYDANLRAIVVKLMATGAELVFANTTPFPDKPGGPLRRSNQAAIYNEIGQEIMRENGIPINNLHDFVKPQMTEIMPPKDVHFTQPGSVELAQQVVHYLEMSLAKR